MAKQKKSNLYWHSSVFFFLSQNTNDRKLEWLIPVIIFRHQKYLLTWAKGNASNQWEKHLFLVYCFRLIDCKAMEKPATAAYGRWRIAVVPTRRLIWTRLLLFNTDHSKERGAQSGWGAVIFPRGREGEIPMWLKNNVALPHQREVRGSKAQMGGE